MTICRLEALLGDYGNTASFQAPDRARTYLVKDIRPEHIHVDRHYSETATESPSDDRQAKGR